MSKRKQNAKKLHEEKNKKIYLKPVNSISFYLGGPSTETTVQQPPSSSSSIAASPQNMMSLYKSTDLRTSFHGDIFQLRLLMLFLYRAEECYSNFFLATEMDVAQKFDDVVLRFQAKPGEWHWRFLQAKHTVNVAGNKITEKNLLTDKACVDVKQEKYPYQAFVQAPIFCSGALISNKHVITIATCVHGAKEVTVYLGFYFFSPLKQNLTNQNGIIHKSKQLIIHENYVKVNDNKYLNNIAIVVLPKPIIFTSTIQPISLYTDTSPLPDLYVNTIEWPGFKSHFSFKSQTVRLCVLRILDTDTCLHHVGSRLATSQELCIDRQSKDIGSWMLFGNLVTLNNNLIGLVSGNPLCFLNCPKYSKFLNLLPFLRWIYKILNVKDLASTEILQQKIEKSHSELTKIDKVLGQLTLTYNKDKAELLSTIKNLKTQYDKEIFELKRLTEVNQIILKEELQKYLKNSINQLKSEYQQDMKLIRTESQQCKTHLDKITKSIETYQKNTEEKFQSLNATISQKQNKIQQDISLIKTESNECKTNIEKQMKLFDNYRRNVDQKLQYLNTNISQLKSEMQRDIPLIKIELQQRKNDNEKQIKLIENCEKNTDQKFEYLKTNITQQKNEMQRDISLINIELKARNNDDEKQIKLIEHYQETMDQKLKYLNANISQQKNNIQQDILLIKTESKECGANIDKQMIIVENYQRNTDQKLQYLNSNISQQNDGTQQCMSLIKVESEESKAVIETQIKVIEDYQRKSDQALRNLNDTVSQQNNKSQQDILQIKSDIEDYKTDIEKQIELVENYQRNTDQQIKNLNANIIQQTNDVRKNTFLISELKEYQANTENKIKVVHNYQKNTDQILLKLNDTIIQKDSDIQQDISQIKADIKDCKTDIEKEMKLINDCQWNTDQITQYLNNNITQQTKEIQKMLELIKIKSGLWSDIQKQIELLKMYERSANQTLQYLNISITQQWNETQKNIKSTKTGSNELKTEIHNKLEIMEQIVDKKFQHLNDHMNLQVKNIKLEWEFIQDQLRKESQHVIDDVNRLNDTIQSIYYNTFNLKHPELS